MEHDDESASKSLLFRPAVINIVAGLVVFAATTSTPALIITWSDLRTLAQRFSDRANAMDERCANNEYRVQRLEEFRSAGDRFTAADGDKLEARVRTMEVDLHQLYRDVTRIETKNNAKN